MYLLAYNLKLNRFTKFQLFEMGGIKSVIVFGCKK